MIPDKGIEFVNVFEEALLAFFRHCMSWHRNAHHDTISLHLGIDFSDTLRCNLGLVVVLCTTVLECEKTLTNWVAVADPAIVDEGHLGVAPAEKITSNLASE